MPILPMWVTWYLTGDWAFIDRSAGASIKNWIVVLDKIQEEFDNDTLFVFGHAFDPEKVTGNKADIKAMQDYLKNLLGICKQPDQSR